MKKQIMILLLILFFLFPNQIFASPVINEFSSADSADWVEIYNSGGESIDLSLYRLRDLTSSNKVDFSGSLDSGTFVSFDWSNKLNNGGDLIKLVLISDESIVDQISYGNQGGITAPEVSQTIGRKPDGSSEWVIFASSSKNASNNSSSTFSSPTPTTTTNPTSSPTSNPTSTKTPTKTPTSSKAASTQAKTTQAVLASQKTANSAKISQEFKVSSSYATLSIVTPELTKKPGKIAVLAARDNNLFIILVSLAGIVFLGIALGVYVKNNLDQIKLWIGKI